MTAAMTRAQSRWLPRTTLSRQHAAPLGWPLPMPNMSLLAASVQFSWPPLSSSRGRQRPESHGRRQRTGPSTGEMADRGQPCPPLAHCPQHLSGLPPVLGEPSGLTTFPPCLRLLKNPLDRGPPPPPSYPCQSLRGSRWSLVSGNAVVPSYWLGWSLLRGKRHPSRGVARPPLSAPDVEPAWQAGSGRHWPPDGGRRTLPPDDPKCGMMTASKRCSLAGADWRVDSTNYPSTEYLFFVYTLQATPIRPVDSGLGAVRASEGGVSVEGPRCRDLRTESRYIGCSRDRPLDRLRRRRGMWVFPSPAGRYGVDRVGRGNRLQLRGHQWVVPPPGPRGTRRGPTDGSTRSDIHSWRGPHQQAVRRVGGSQRMLGWHGGCCWARRLEHIAGRGATSGLGRVSE